MTIPQLLNLTVEQLEAMSHEELLKHCEPYLAITQGKADTEPEDDTPELVDLADTEEDKATRAKAKAKARRKNNQDWLREAIKLANANGVTLQLPPNMKKL